jgi:hypothetical protein
MFEFILKFLKKNKKPSDTERLRKTQPSKIIRPEEFNEKADPYEEESTISHDPEAGYVNFNKLEPITRKFKRKKLRESFEDRQTDFYGRDGRLYD